VVFVVENVALGQASSQQFRFTSQFLFHQTLHTHLPSGAGEMGQLVVDVPRGLILTPTPRNLKESKGAIIDRLGSLLVRVPGYRTEMYCVSCKVPTEFMYVM
jgi:hypothetical protein